MQEIHKLACEPYFDELRLKLFYKAIHRLVFYDSEVLVTGDPLGVIAKFCVKEGARRVWLYENRFYSLASKNCESSHAIQVIRKDCRSHKTPVNVTVFYSGNPVSFLKSWEILVKNGVVSDKTRKIPTRTSMSVEPVWYQDEFCMIGVSTPIPCEVEPIQRFSSPSKVFDTKTDSLPKSKKFDFTCNDHGWVNGMRVSFCEFVTENSLLSDTERTIRSMNTPIQAFEVEKNDKITGEIRTDEMFSCFCNKVLE